MLENGHILQFRRALSVENQAREENASLFLQIFNNLTFIGSGTLNKIVITLPVGPCYCPDSEVIYSANERRESASANFAFLLALFRRFIEYLFCLFAYVTRSLFLIP